MVPVLVPPPLLLAPSLLLLPLPISSLVPPPATLLELAEPLHGGSCVIRAVPSYRVGAGDGSCRQEGMQTVRATALHKCTGTWIHARHCTLVRQHAAGALCKLQTSVACCEAVNPTRLASLPPCCKTHTGA